MRKIKTQDVLKVLAVGGIVIGSAVVPSLPMILVKTYKLWKEVSSSDMGRIIRRLQKQQMISMKEKNDKITIEITEKGKRRLLEYDFENIKIARKKRDGKWRIIIFDIPEGRKRNRDAFRKKLIQMGCVRLQDSVFVCAFPCKNEIDFLSHYLEISDFVTLATIGKIERGEELMFKKYHDWDNNTL